MHPISSLFTLLSTTRGTNTSRCILPLGVVLAEMGVEAPGAECMDVLAAPDCITLLAKIENGTLPSAVSSV